MTRRRKGSPVHGWVIVDKETGPTSTQVTSRIRRLFDAQKAGYAGTLDPEASGILPVALGEATKTVSHVMEGEKIYRFTARFGEARDTGDGSGKIVATSEVRPGDDEIEAALPTFVGAISQVPPVYSAVKIEGRRAYSRARRGDDTPPPARLVRVNRFTLEDRPDADHAVFEVACGKGTYIRSLARDLAEALGTCAHAVDLRRTAVGPFSERDATTLEELAARSEITSGLLPVGSALKEIPTVNLSESEAEDMRYGRPVPARAREIRRPGTALFAVSGDRPVALARLVEDEIRPVRVLNV